MPTKTFFQLPTAKKNLLIAAAKKEFARVPLHEASIANIVKEAGIPRGSFYQYFEGKEDLYYYLLDEISKVDNEEFIRLLKLHEGDIFKTFVAFFRFFIAKDAIDEDRSFHKHAFLNMNYKIKNILANNIYEQNQKKHYRTITNLMDKSQLNISSEEDITRLYTILLSVTFHNFVQVFVKDLSLEEALENYEKQMDLMMFGLYKGD